MSLDNRLRGFHVEEERPNIDEALAYVQRKARRALGIRRVGIVALAALAVAAAITVPELTGRERKSEPIRPAPRPSPSMSFHPATPADHARLIAYTDKRDLWLYDVREDREKRLTNDGDRRIERGPVFLGDDHILYQSTNPSAIEAIPVTGGEPVVVLREEGTIFDFDVSPDGSTIVYVHANFDTDAVHRLKRIDLSGRKSSVLRTIGTPPGRGAGSEDEISIARSPDGRRILMTDTSIDTEPMRSIFLMDRDGADVIPPWGGTHARWSPDGKTIYYRGYAGSSDMKWRAFDVAAKTTRTLGFRPGSNNLAISSDGTRVAYDTSYFGDTPPEAIRSGEAPAVYVYDIRNGTETLIKKGALWPLWVSPNELLATDAKRPPPRTSLNSWETIGTVTKFTVAGKRSTVAITSTLWDASALFDR